MTGQAVHKRITNLEELVGRSHAILEDRLIRIENLLLSDPARASIAETTMMWQLLYGAVARFGLSMSGSEVATVQLPMLTIPANHRLLWDKDETTGLVRISIVADPVPTQDLTLPDAGSEPVPANNETLPEILASPGSDVQVGSPSGLIIEPQDAPFVDDEEEALAAMTAAILEEE